VGANKRIANEVKGVYTGEVNGDLATQIKHTVYNLVIKRGVIMSEAH
jgi:hypothetical protein